MSIVSDGLLILSYRNASVGEVEQPADVQHSREKKSEDGANASEPPSIFRMSSNEESDSSDEGEVDYDPPEEFEDVRDKFMETPLSHGSMRSEIHVCEFGFSPFCVKTTHVVFLFFGFHTKSVLEKFLSM